MPCDAMLGPVIAAVLHQYADKGGRIVIEADELPGVFTEIARGLAASGTA